MRVCSECKTSCLSVQPSNRGRLRKQRLASIHRPDSKSERTSWRRPESDIYIWMIALTRCRWENSDDVTQQWGGSAVFAMESSTDVHENLFNRSSIFQCHNNQLKTILKTKGRQVTYNFSNLLLLIILLNSFLVPLVFVLFLYRPCLPYILNLTAHTKHAVVNYKWRQRLWQIVNNTTSGNCGNDSRRKYVTDVLMALNLTHWSWQDVLKAAYSPTVSWIDG